ncbi:MAG: HAD family hydrolase [Haloechinothrix sp.]
MERTGSRFDNGHTVLIGDTPNDVQAGTTAGVRVIGVASGKSTSDDLRAAGASAVLADLRSLDALVRLIRNAA